MPDSPNEGHTRRAPPMPSEGTQPDLDLRGVGPRPMTMDWIHGRLNDRRLKMRKPLRILLDREQAADLNIEVRMSGTPTLVEGIEVVVYGVPDAK